MLSFLCHATNNGNEVVGVAGRSIEMGGEKTVWRSGVRVGTGFASGGFVKAGRDRVPHLVVVGVGLPKPTRAASEREPNKKS